jgi:putative transposase
MPDWHHAPLHRLHEAGAYIVTAGTYQKLHHFHTPRRLDLALNGLFECAEEFGWSLQAWAVMSNHYHFVASSPADPSTLGRMISKLHSQTARALNAWDGQAGRRIWFQYYETHLTYQASYYARLKYVHQNPVHHSLVQRAENWRWCSAGWFEQAAHSAFQRLLDGVKTDRIHMADAFEPVVPEPEEEAKAASSRRTP